MFARSVRVVVVLALGVNGAGCTIGPVAEDAATDGGAPRPDVGVDAPGPCDDRDGDGHIAIECGGDDCDDADPMRSPDRVEVCDAASIDEDCDPTTYGDHDADGDGYTSGVCCNRDGPDLRCGPDCDDGDPMIRPGERETCDGFDNDCDGRLDEDALVTFYRDVDGDSYGVSSMTRLGCTAPVGYVPLDGDCDDTLPTVHPGAAETCNGRDDDCDGTVDPGCACSAGASRACGTPDGMGGFSDIGECRPGTQACSSGVWGSCVGAVPPAAETCNGLDDDCDGIADDGVLRTFYRDDDADGAGDDGTTVEACTMPPGYAARGGDCDDSSAMIGPGAPELCNARDDDCDTGIDEGVKSTFYADTDGDGFGSPSSRALACAAPPGYVARAGDCDDTTPTVSPDAVEACNSIDDNCDGVIDEGCACTPGASRECGTSDGMGGFLSRGICRPGTQSCTSGTWTTCSGNVAPLPAETCNDLDDDCDGRTDEDALAAFYADCDRDTFGATGSAPTLSCTEPGTGPTPCPAAAWSTMATDCNDAAETVHPGAPDICNGVDDDCNGITDDEPGATMSCAASAPPHAVPACAAGACGFTCTTGYAGAACDECATGYTGYPTCTPDPCSPTSCNGHGSCSDGVCSCDAGYAGTSCDACAAGFTGYPTCDPDPCHGVTCSGHGTCGGGTCTCSPGYAGPTCSGCATGYTGYPSCLPDPCFGVTCSGHGTCSGGTCTCYGAYSGATCNTCAEGYVDYPECDRVTCGDGICGLGETSVTCCDDCGCPSGSSCFGTACENTGSRRIDAGYRHTCLVVPNGEAHCWGSNSDGQLGYGSSGSGTYSSVPSRVTAITNAVSVAVGEAHSCVVLSDRTVRCWGRNTNGQLGDGTTTRRTTPVSVSGLTNVAQIDAGADYTCARTTAGAIRCWGSNGWGQMGLGSTGGNQVFVGGSAIASGAVHLGTGRSHVCAVLGGGSVQCWGYGETGRVTGETLDHATYSTPQTVSGVTSAVSAAPGDQHTCAVLEDGTALCWGGNQFGQCGRGTTFWAGGESPGPVLSLDAINDLDAGNNHSCAARTDGSVQCWGPNTDGRIGDGSTTSALSPRAVPGITDAMQVAAGANHSCALSTTGTVRCWGRASEGQVGDGTTGDGDGRRLLPTSVSGTEASGDLYAGARVCVPGSDPLPCECEGASPAMASCNAEGSGWVDCPCDSPTEMITLCTPGSASSCACPGGETGTRTCASDGMSLTGCDCPMPGPGADTIYSIYIHGLRFIGQGPPGGGERCIGDDDDLDDRSCWEYWSATNTAPPGVNPVSVNWDGTRRIASQNAVIVSALDELCTGSNACYVACHSAGCIQIEYALDRATSAGTWNILRVFAAGSAEGGSELADVGYGFTIGLSCAILPLACDLNPSTVRSSSFYDHMNTRGVTITMIAGARSEYYLGGLDIGYVTRYGVWGDDDAIVGFHSSLGMRTQAAYCRRGFPMCDPVEPTGSDGHPDQFANRTIDFVDAEGRYGHDSIKEELFEAMRGSAR